MLLLLATVHCLPPFSNLLNGTYYLSVQSKIEGGDLLLRFDLRTEVNSILLRIYSTFDGVDGFLLANNSIFRATINGTDGTFKVGDTIGQYLDLQKFMVRLKIEGGPYNKAIKMDYFLKFAIYLDNDQADTLTSFFLIGYLHTFRQRTADFLDVYLGNSTTSYICSSNLTNNWYKVLAFFKTNNQSEISHTVLAIRSFKNVAPFNLTLQVSYTILNGTNTSRDWLMVQLGPKPALISKTQLDYKAPSLNSNSFLQVLDSGYKDKQYGYVTYKRSLKVEQQNVVEIPYMTALNYCLNLTETSLTNQDLRYGFDNCLSVIVFSGWLLAPALCLLLL